MDPPPLDPDEIARRLAPDADIAHALPGYEARLIDVGYADLRLFVERPPRTLAAAQRLAAEQVVLGGDCTGGGRGIPGIAARLVNGPIWTFWWD